MSGKMELDYFKSVIKPLIYDGLSSAKNSHDIAFGDNREIDDLLAGVFLNDATSHINSAKIFYIQNPDFGHYEFDDFFNKYDTYRGEILNNIRTKHSHQWTDIEYLSFLEAAKPLADLIDLKITHFYKEDLD